MGKQAAIYIRISTQQQNTDRQKQDLWAFAEKEGYDIYEIYTDVVSGFKKNEDMPDLERLKADSTKNLFSVILFSEFTRLSRTVTELNQSIDFFRDHDVDLFFQKQNIWVRKDGDLGTDILIQVLGVVASYEIELFAERSTSGKISALKNRGINLGGLPAFGYKSEDKTKRLIIDPDEVSTVKRIFKMYSDGLSAQKICDILNSENSKSPYKKRIAESIERRNQKGFDEKNYKRFNVESLVWTAASLTKILKNRLYIGERNSTMHKPDPTNTDKIEKRKNREILEIINITDETLRIIEEDLFIDVQAKLKENYLIKNTPTLHPTLLKSILKCGCCGRNVVSAKANGAYKYMCFGKIKDTKTRNINCTDSLEIAQYKLDGLVVQMILFRLADADRANKSTIRIDELTLQNEQNAKILLNKESELKTETETWLKYFEKSIRFDIPEDAIQDRKNEYDTKSQKLNQEINKLKAEIHNSENTIKSIKAMATSETLKQQEETIRANKTLLKQLTNEYIESVSLYPIFDKYSLVIVNFKDGSESWGTIKSAKYKKDEIWYDPTYCKVPHYIYQLWDNDDKSAEYNHNNKTVLYKGKTITTWNSAEPNESKPRFETIPREGQTPIIRMLKSEASTDDSNSVQVTIPDPCITIKTGIYPIKEFITLLKEGNANGHNNNGDFPPYDFHEDEEGHEDSIEKAKQYRLDNADKRNARTKELREIRKPKSK
jgi:DNA invertase Pin-like site-specific DNA recombinase